MNSLVLSEGGERKRNLTTTGLGENMTPKNEENAHGSSDEENSDSSGSDADVGSEDDASDVSDQDKFKEAHSDFGALTAGVDPRTLERTCSGHTNEDVSGLVFFFFCSMLLG